MKWVVTGGVGFIGTNLTDHLLELGHEVLILDDLSREGVIENARYLEGKYGISPRITDISNNQELVTALDEFDGFDVIVNLAGQVSFMDSIRNPRRDFEINALGTLNVLEYVRKFLPSAVVIGMSSNKLYGDLATVAIVEGATRYFVPDWPNGFDETLPLDFRGPYGCSKGIADQYLADYARIYGLRTASLRQSSVYGPHQHPRADQGWVAHLTREVVKGNLIQLNGIGKQVRDLLHASDLSRLFVELGNSVTAGIGWQINVGGGSKNSLSILELFTRLEGLTGRAAKFSTGETRPSDQMVFVSDNVKVKSLTGWVPNVDLSVGLNSLLEEIEIGN